MVYLDRWKVILILGVCAWGLLTAAPNLLGPETRAALQRHAPAFIPSQSVNLGLDLRGGSYLLLEVETQAVIEERLQSLVDQVRTELRGARIGYTELGRHDQTVQFKPANPDQAGAARDLIRKIDSTLDVQTTDGWVVLSIPESERLARERAALGQSIEIVRRRIDETGTREPSIQGQGTNRILVQLPGVEDPGHIKKLLGQTAKLTFRLVEDRSQDSHAPTPPGTERLPSAEQDGLFWIVQKRVMVSGDTLVDSQPSFQESEAVVSFRFDSLGGKRFAEATRANVGRPFAIVLDNKVISAPVIREPILGGSGVISGHFTTQSASDLALLLRAGALPAPIKVLEERTVGPGLGADSIRSGAVSSVIGLALAGTFFVVYYGLFGVFAALALIINIVLLFGALSFLQATLTLPGIAGIVLTIGMSFDANVLVFERIREEQSLGRSPIAAIDAGYNRALSAIMDANITTLIAAVFLFMFGSGPVRGFAVTLGLGILTALFSSLMVTRLITVVWLRVKRPKVIPL